MQPLSLMSCLGCVAVFWLMLPGDVAGISRSVLRVFGVELVLSLMVTHLSLLPIILAYS